MLTASEHGHHLAHRHARDVDDVATVENSHRAALVRLVRKLSIHGCASRQVARTEKAEAEFQDTWREPVLAPRGSHVAQVLEREHERRRAAARESPDLAAISASVALGRSPVTLGNTASPRASD